MPKWKWGSRENGLVEFLSRPAWRQEVVIFVDDDLLKRRQWRDLAQGEGWNARAVDSAYEANKETAAAVYVIDISAVSGLYPVCTLMENHPGSGVIILSAVGRRCAEDVLDQIEEHTGVRPLYGGTGTWDELLPVLRQAVGAE